MKCFLLILCCICLLQCTMFQSRVPKALDLKGSIKTDSIQNMLMVDSLKTEIWIDSAKKCNIENFIRVQEYVFLEASEHSLIGQIEKIIIYKDRIYILDSDVAKTVFIYHRNGKFINKISGYGYPPVAYNYLRDMEIDSIQQRLVVYDRNEGKLLFYDLDGDFIKIENLGLRFSNFKILPDGNYVLFTNNNQNGFNLSISSYSLLIGQPNGQILFRGFPNSNFMTELNYSGLFNVFSHHGITCICPRLSNSLYQIDANGTLRTLYQFHLPIGSMEEYLRLNPHNFRNEAANFGYYYSLGDYCMMSDSVVFFKYIDPKMSFCNLWYNRSNGKQHSTSYTFSDSNLFIDAPNPLCVHNNQFVGVIDASVVAKSKSAFLAAHRMENDRYLARVKQLENGNSYSKKMASHLKMILTDRLPENILSKFEKMKEDDNPVLMFYTIKWSDAFYEQRQGR